MFSMTKKKYLGRKIVYTLKMKIYTQKMFEIPMVVSKLEILISMYANIFPLSFILKEAVQI